MTIGPIAGKIKQVVNPVGPEMSPQQGQRISPTEASVNSKWREILTHIALERRRAEVYVGKKIIFNEFVTRNHAAVSKRWITRMVAFGTCVSRRDGDRFP